jgi:hypothetical protein
MNDWTKAWLVVACITLIMIFFNLARAAENPDGTTTLTGNNMIERYNTEAGLNDNDPYSSLPSGSSDATDQFTDEYRVTQTYFAAGHGSNLLQDVLSAPYNIMKSMQLPSDIVNVLGTFWWLLVGILFVMMLTGREK